MPILIAVGILILFYMILQDDMEAQRDKWRKKAEEENANRWPY